MAFDFNAAISGKGQSKGFDFDAAIQKDLASPGYISDIAKSAATGIREGAESIAGIPGRTMGLVPKITGAMGIPETATRAVMKTFGFDLPTPSDIHAATSKHIGESYEPQTIPGEYAKTAGEFLPYSIGGPESLAYGGISALGSETGGQLTKGTPDEPYARIAGAIAAPWTASKVIPEQIARLGGKVAAATPEARPVPQREEIGPIPERGYPNTPVPYVHQPSEYDIRSPSDFRERVHRPSGPIYGQAPEAQGELPSPPGGYRLPRTSTIYGRAPKEPLALPAPERKAPSPWQNEAGTKYTDDIFSRRIKLDNDLEELNKRVDRGEIAEQDYEAYQRDIIRNSGLTDYEIRATADEARARLQDPNHPAFSEHNPSFLKDIPEKHKRMLSEAERSRTTTVAKQPKDINVYGGFTVGDNVQLRQVIGGQYFTGKGGRIEKLVLKPEKVLKPGPEGRSITSTEQVPYAQLDDGREVKLSLLHKIGAENKSQVEQARQKPPSASPEEVQKMLKGKKPDTINDLINDKTLAPQQFVNRLRDAGRDDTVIERALAEKGYNQQQIYDLMTTPRYGSSVEFSQEAPKKSKPNLTVVPKKVKGIIEPKKVQTKPSEKGYYKLKSFNSFIDWARGQKSLSWGKGKFSYLDQLAKQRIGGPKGTDTSVKSLVSGLNSLIEDGKVKIYPEGDPGKPLTKINAKHLKPDEWEHDFVVEFLD